VESNPIGQILIVDDDANVREVLRRFLEPAGYAVREAESAEAGVRSVEQTLTSVAFCDLHMPGANGLWLADRIRTISPATAMILATGDSGIPPGESLRAGVIAYLVKPLTSRRVLEAAADGVRWSAEARERGGRRIHTRSITTAIP
jgi:DNA-binding NtrC family response regulator